MLRFFQVVTRAPGDVFLISGQVPATTFSGADYQEKSPLGSSLSIFQGLECFQRGLTRCFQIDNRGGIG